MAKDMQNRSMSMCSNTVNLHTINLDVSSAVRAKCRQFLSEEEKCRADRFSRPMLSERWLVARAGLRDVLASYCCKAPDDLEFDYEQFGKPVLAKRHADANLHFNQSHSLNLAVVAITRTGPVGVDLEYVRTIRDWENVASRFFSRCENLQLSDVEESSRQEAFYCCWTRKEAVIKATGEGLSARLDSFDVSLAPGVRAEVLTDRAARRGGGDWHLQHFDLANRFVGAVALRGSGGISVKLHEPWTFDYV